MSRSQFSLKSSFSMLWHFLTHFMYLELSKAENPSNWSERNKKRKLEGRRFPCDKCEFASTTKFDLNRHFDETHEGVRFPCNKCDYAATKASALKVHIKSKHEGVKYPCEKCEHVATNSSNLRAHIKSQHDGVKYHCDTCEYTTTFISSEHISRLNMKE